MSIFDWTSDRGEPRRAKSDQVSVEFRFIEDLLVNEAVEDWIVSSAGSAWEEDWLILEVEKVVRDGYQDEHGNWISPGPLYDAQVVRRRINWGADASFFSILIDLGVGLIGAATWESIKGLGGRMADRLKASRESFDRPLSGQEAYERVVWILSQRYKRDWNSFRLVGTDETEAEFSVTVEDGDGVRYFCTLVVIDGLVDVVRVRREFPR